MNSLPAISQPCDTKSPVDEFSSEPLRLKRWPGNPILAPINNDWERLQVRNPTAWYDGNKVRLIYSARAVMNNIYLGLAVSDDGKTFSRASDRPFFGPSEKGFDGGTTEDPRIVKIQDDYYVTYVSRAVGKQDFLDGVRAEEAKSNDGITWTQNARRGGLFRTRDFKSIERLGPITSDRLYDCNVILFPEKVGGRYVMLHRPSPYNEEVENQEIDMNRPAPGIHMAFSDDLLNWTDDLILAVPEQQWESLKIGGSSPPIKTEAGWLTFYHGVEDTSVGRIYRAGVMLLDLWDPSKIIARCPYPVLEPVEDYEKFGTVNHVVFPCGNVVIDGILHVYYGGADTVCALATAPLDSFLENLLRFKK